MGHIFQLQPCEKLPGPKKSCKMMFFKWDGVMMLSKISVSYLPNHLPRKCDLLVILELQRTHNGKFRDPNNGFCLDIKVGKGNKWLQVTKVEGMFQDASSFSWRHRLTDWQVSKSSKSNLIHKQYTETHSKRWMTWSTFWNIMCLSSFHAFSTLPWYLKQDQPFTNRTGDAFLTIRNRSQSIRELIYPYNLR